VSILEMDWYYKKDQSEVPTCDGAPNFDHPNAIDTPLLAAHVAALGRGEGVDAPMYDFARARRLESTRRVEAGKVCQRVC
jgi:uridine kinase